jgi:hypothetical protein
VILAEETGIGNAINYFFAKGLPINTKTGEHSITKVNNGKKKIGLGNIYIYESSPRSHFRPSFPSYHLQLGRLNGSAVSLVGSGFL